MKLLVLQSVFPTTIAVGSAHTHQHMGGSRIDRWIATCADVHLVFPPFVPRNGRRRTFCRTADNMGFIFLFISLTSHLFVIRL